MVLVEGLEQRYGNDVALRIERWQMQAGEHWLVSGPSGCGKSTLLHLLAGLQRPSAGRVLVFGKDLAALDAAEIDRWRGATVGIVLQTLHLVAHLSVRANLRLAQYLAGAPQNEAAIDDVLSALGVTDKAVRRPRELSQGEQQRVAVARAVVNGPKLLLADEPTASLDDAAAARAIELLAGEAERRAATLVVATHDARVKARFTRQLDLAR
jgi:putative ABC transport system ATP-binding protein